MTPYPVSAFEAYQKPKKKKSSISKKHKNKELKNIPSLGSELQMIARDKSSSKSITHKNIEINLPDNSERVVRKKKQFPHKSKPGHPNSTNQEDVQNSPEIKRNSGTLKKVVSPQKSDGSNYFELDESNDIYSKASEGKDVELPENVEYKKKKTKSMKSKSRISKSEAKNNGGNVPQFEVISPYVVNSVEAAESTFTWMVNPIEKESFFSQYWEKRPVHISREKHRDYYSSILSSSSIDKLLRSNKLLFGKNVDVTSYTDGERKTHNPVGRALAGVVWDFYRHGCSVRLLNPQTYIPELCELNSILQELFGSFVGANVYLTPPNSQGFAPHYDDIEAFVLQIEGCKFWRVYAPRHRSESLPRTSSGNFAQEEIGKPILEVLLKEGDLLYFPRGFIHQAHTVPGHHSLHVTVSTYQRNSWADLLEKLVPAALANAVEEDEEFRRGMPLNVLDHLGVVHSDSESPERQHILAKIQTLFSKLFEHAPVDAAADQLGKEYQHDALPPCLTLDEERCSVFENSDRMEANGKLRGTVALTRGTQIRLTRSKVLRLVSEEEPDIVKLYHCMDNSLVYHEESPQYIEIPVSMGPAVEFLINSYPKFVPISMLPLDEAHEKLQVAIELWERGLVLTEAPLPFVSEDSQDAPC